MVFACPGTFHDLIIIIIRPFLSPGAKKGVSCKLVVNDFGVVVKSD